MDILPGESFKGWQIIKRIGSGGFGAVYMVKRGENELGALKILHPNHSDNEKLVHRFHREARLASRIRCSWTPLIFDHGEEDGCHYILMEYARGIDLKEYQNKGFIPGPDDIISEDTTIKIDDSATISISDNCDTVAIQNLDDTLNVTADEMPVKEGPPFKGDEETAITIILQCAEVLCRAEEQNLIHRDIKPANILIRRNGKGNIESSLIDFGLAKCFTDNTLNISLQGQAMGTPAYMSPEQVRGLKPDIRSDIYSLGMTIYTFVTTLLPFKGPGTKEYLEQIVTGNPENPRKYNKQLSPAFIKLLGRMTNKDQDKRIQRPEEIIQIIKDIKSSPQAAAGKFVWLKIFVILLLSLSLAGIVILKKKKIPAKKPVTSSVAEEIEKKKTFSAFEQNKKVSMGDSGREENNEATESSKEQELQKSYSEKIVQEEKEHLEPEADNSSERYRKMEEPGKEEKKLTLSEKERREILLQKRKNQIPFGVKKTYDY